MEVLASVLQPGRSLKDLVVAIGAFDGVHRGHLELLQTARSLASASHGEAAVLTFDPHPAKVLSPTVAPPLITSTRRKLELCEAAGIGLAVVQAFDAAFAALEPGEFVDRALVHGIGARHVVVGYDFSYGHARGGNIATLKDAGRAHGFAVTVVPAFSSEGVLCSSTRIRDAVRSGEIALAERLLGRPVEIVGSVVPGHGRGRTMGIPTANISLEAELLPPVGVYAAWVMDAEEDVPRRRQSVVNVGYAPTFANPSALSIETHVLDFSGDLYSRRLIVELRERLRGEQRFPSPEALRQQIDRDIARTREMLR